MAYLIPWLRWYSGGPSLNQCPSAISLELHIISINFKQVFIYNFRILWLILFLGCAGILVVQVSTNVLYYLSWPMSVDVRINYNDSILFPAVTICNQNAFRYCVLCKFYISV